MASIHTRRNADGTVSYRVMYLVAGKTRSSAFREPKAAEQYRQLVERLGGDAAEQVRGLRASTSTDVPTLEEWLDHHLQHLTGVTPGTVAEYERVAKRTWLPHLGPLPVNLITRDHVTRWVGLQTKAQVQTSPTAEKKPMAAKTIKNAHNLLSSVLQSAVPRWRLDNPAKGVQLPRGLVEEMTFLSEEEFGVLLDHIPPHYQPLVLTLAGTGLRWGEATALRWGEVDLDADVPVLRVTRAWKAGAKVKELGPPKTRKSRRTVSLPAQVADALRPMKGKADSLVFTTPRGGVVHSQSFRPRVWQRAIEASGLGKTPRIHDLRHTSVSWQIAAGVPLPIIQRRLGHESIQTTVDRYGHLSGSALEVAAAALTAALAVARPEVLALENGQGLREGVEDESGQ